MTETLTQTATEQTSKRDSGISKIAFKGLNLMGDKTIASEPFVDGEGDQREYYVNVLSPGDHGLKTEKMPFETALQQLRSKHDYK